MNRLLCALAAASVFTLALSGGGQAADPSIRVTGDGTVATNYDAVLGQVTDLIAGQAAEAAAGGSSGGTFYFDLNRPLGGNAGFASLGPGDQSLARAAKSTYDLYRALGGQELDTAAFIERRDNRFYVGLDGEGGRWLATPEEALGSLIDQIQAYQFRFSRGGPGTTSCPLDFRCLLKATYEGALETTAYAPRGTTVELEMTGAGFAQNPGPPVLKVPAGLTVHDVTFADSETITARVSIGAGAELGVNAIYVFNEGIAFRPTGAYGLRVVASAAALQALLLELSAGVATASAETGTASDATLTLPADYDGPALLSGTGEAEALVDDAGADTASATVMTLGTTLSAQLGSDGDVDLFRIELASAGMLTVASAGPTDITGRLEDGDGTVLMSDDDSGPWYNFRISGALSAGSYFLRVSHCCAGTGSYRLSGSLSTD